VLVCTRGGKLHGDAGGRKTRAKEDRYGGNNGNARDDNRREQMRAEVRARYEDVDLFNRKGTTSNRKKERTNRTEHKEGRTHSEMGKLMHSCAWVDEIFGQYLYVTSYMVEGIQIHPAPNPPLRWPLRPWVMYQYHSPSPG